MSNKLVSIIIVTAGKDGYPWSLLDSIKKQTHSDFEVMIIDNSLNQDFCRKISEHYPDFKIYSSGNNLFYCEAINKGIDNSNTEFTLCLNDDVILDKKFIEEALRGFSVDTMVGMVSGKILRRDGQMIDSTGLFLSPWRSAKERGYGCRDAGKFEKEGYIFGVNGAVAFYRREMLEQIKIGSEYFDSEYRIFYEDLDIAWRAQNFGWKGYYVPLAVAYHTRGATVRHNKGIDRRYARHYLNDEMHIDLIKNRYLTLIKNETFLGFLFNLPFIIIYDIFVWGYILFFNPLLLKKFFTQLIPISSAFKKRALLRKKQYLQKR